MFQADLLDDATRHGSLAGYDAGCRGRACAATFSCEAVKTRHRSDWAFRSHLGGGGDAQAYLQAELDAAKLAEATTRVIPETVAHGSIATYNRHKCRCAPCCEAKSQKAARLRAGKKRTESRTPSSFATLNETRIRELHAQGLTDGLIGARLGVSAATICAARKDFDLPHNAKPTPKKDHTTEYAQHADRVKELHAQGLDDARIAADIGRTRYFVKGLRAAYKLKGRSGKPVVLAEHGTAARAWQKCICGPCAQAKSAYYRERYLERKAKVAA